MADLDCSEELGVDEDSAALKKVWLKPEVVASMLGISKSLLGNLRRDGSGPPFIRLGSKIVLYDQEDVLDFLAGLKRQ